MKLIVCLVACFVYATTSSAQYQELNIDSLARLSSKPLRIYFSATWCSPCMGEYKIATEKFKTDTVYNNYVVFDRYGYSIERLQKFTPNLYDTSRTLLLPYRFYQHSKIISVNPQNKAFKNFLHDTNRKLGSQLKMSEFWYGDYLIVRGKEIEVVKHS